ncbi:MAG: hypothetical protein JWP91_1356 [Fibrobacteres bacterium]|nr:hypothetical protein [Fibrobacterota bacterium]
MKNPLNQPTHKRMISIWTWVGLVLAVYGGLVFICGVYYMSNPVAVRGHHPGLWWGGVMILASLWFLYAGKKETV